MWIYPNPLGNSSPWIKVIKTITLSILVSFTISFNMSLCWWLRDPFHSTKITSESCAKWTATPKLKSGFSVQHLILILSCLNIDELSSVWQQHSNSNRLADTCNPFEPAVEDDIAGYTKLSQCFLIPSWHDVKMPCHAVKMTPCVKHLKLPLSFG